MSSLSVHATAFFERARRAAGEAAAFCTVGAAAFAVDSGGSNVLHFGAGLGPLTAKALSTVASTLVAYAGNRMWTFRDRERDRSLRRCALFFALNGVAMAISLACLGFTRYLLGLSGPLAYNLSANVIGVGLGTVFRYWSYRRWVFPRRPASPLPEAAGETAGEIADDATDGRADGTAADAARGTAGVTTGLPAAHPVGTTPVPVPAGRR
jgi:putative flippase GtrA